MAIGRALVWSSRNRVLQQRLSIVADTITILNVRIRELERLRDQLEKARLAARRSSRNRSSEQNHLSRQTTEAPLSDTSSARVEPHLARRGCRPRNQLELR
jgi:hypothetical protein